MIYLSVAFIVLGAITLTFFLLEKTKNYSVKAVMLKSIASLFFIATAAIGLYKNGHHILTLFVVLGLIFGMLGDIFLDLKYVYRNDDKSYTYAGFIAFGIGHILYITGMFLEFYHDENVLYIILPLVVGTIGGVVNVFLEKLMKLKYGDMKVASAMYGITLFSMILVAISISILNKFQNVTSIMFLVGGALFVVSDLILSGTYFGEGKERPVDIITNTVTYYMAQFTIAFAMFFL